MVVVIDDNMSTLMDFRYKRKYVAANGMDGGGKRCTGRNGADLTLRVPRGTIIRDAETKEIICDMSQTQTQSFVLCKGGRGGWGNQHFATPTRQVPRFAKAGLPGQERQVILELKLLADVGLVGFPNVASSTLPLCGEQGPAQDRQLPFHHLVSQSGRGVCGGGCLLRPGRHPRASSRGAAEGAGLGHDFLRHIDRCRLLIHVVDVSGSEAATRWPTLRPSRPS